MDLNLDTGLEDIELEDLSNIDLDLDFSNIDTNIDLSEVDIDPKKMLEEINKLDFSLEEINLEMD